MRVESYTFEVFGEGGNGGDDGDVQDITEWLQDNWVILAVGGGGLIFLNAFLKRRKNRPMDIVIQSPPIQPYYGPT